MDLAVALSARFDDMYDRVTRSGAAAALVIFAVYAIACLRLDDYPILPDGLRSIATAGAFDPAPDLSLVFGRLNAISQQHVPGYFVALHFWGNLAGFSPLVLRALSLFFGLLSLAFMYRLGRDFICPQAGFAALIMLSSLYFYNLWYLPIRMYTMFVAAGLAFLWIYFRIVIGGKRSPRHFAALCLACLLFLNSQVFSLAILFGVALAHLFIVPKSRARLWTTLSLGLAALLFLPWLTTLLVGAEEIAAGEFGDIQILTPLETVETVLRLGLNGSLLFLLPLALSLRSFIRRERLGMALWLILPAATCFTIVVNQMTNAIDLHRSRYLVCLLPLVILLVVIGLRHLPRWRWLHLAILLFWLAGGLLFQRRFAPQVYVQSYGAIPIHLIERHLRDDLQAGDLIVGYSEGLSFEYSTPYGRVADYYFAEHAVDVVIEHNYWLDLRGEAEDRRRLEDLIAGRDRVWLIYEWDNNPRWRDLYQTSLLESHKRCHSDGSVYHVAIELYRRDACEN